MQHSLQVKMKAFTVPLFVFMTVLIINSNASPLEEEKPMSIEASADQVDLVEGTFTLLS